MAIPQPESTPKSSVLPEHLSIPKMFRPSEQKGKIPERAHERIGRSKGVFLKKGG